MSGLMEAGFILFLVIAICGNDERVCSFAWTMWIVCAVLTMTAWMAGMPF